MAGESLEHVMGGVQSGGGVSCPVTGGFRVSSDGIATQQRASSPPTPDAQVFALPTQAVLTANSPGTVMLVTVSLSLTLVSPILDRVSSLSGPHGSLWTSAFTFITHPNFHHPWSISQGAHDGVPVPASQMSCVCSGDLWGVVRTQELLSFPLRWAYFYKGRRVRDQLTYDQT